MPLTGDSTWQEALALDKKDQPTFLIDRADRLIPQTTWDDLGWTEDNWK